MNIDFKICWFEDTPEWFEDASEYVEEYISNLCFIPRITLYENGDFDIETLKNNDYDLVLVDYTLDRSSSGIDIISQLRSNDIYTEIIFYSSQYDKMKKAVLANNEVLDVIDGVFFSERDSGDFYNKVEGVVTKLIKRAEDIVNVRGIVLDNACDFDKKMDDILLAALSKFGPEKRNKINKKAKEIVESSITGKVNKVESYASSNSYVVDLVQDKKTYILESYHKARLVNRVIKILKEDDVIPNTEYSDFLNEYLDEIIKVRNMIAHVSYNIAKDAFIGKINGEEICLTCDKVKEIRQDIIKHKRQFDQLDEIISSI